MSESDSFIEPDGLPEPGPSGILATLYLTVADTRVSSNFYVSVLGGELVFRGEGDPAATLTMVRLANTWIIVNIGGGPTDDKPDVWLTPPAGHVHTSSFLNLRVTDIHRRVAEWRERGAQFLTEPKDHGDEIRCYIRDPDGYLIEVGEHTGLFA